MVGRKRLLAEFRERSPHAASVVGEAPAWGSMLSRVSAGQLAAPLVRAWRDQHAQRYLDALAEADSHGAVVWGLDKVWDAMLAGQVERMWVERGYWLPGKLEDGGKRLVLVDAEGTHAMVPDIVDRVIESAALAGAHVEMVDRLGEAEDHHIAAELGHALGQDENSAAKAS